MVGVMTLAEFICRIFGNPKPLTDINVIVCRKLIYMFAEVSTKPGMVGVL
jgi:hypothetical protein